MDRYWRKALSRPGKLLVLATLVTPMLLVACTGESTPTPGNAPGAATATTGGTAGATATGAEQPTAAATTATTAGGGTPTTAGATGGSSGVLRWSNEGVSEIDTLDPPKTQSSNSVMASTLIYEGLV